MEVQVKVAAASAACASSKQHASRPWTMRLSGWSGARQGQDLRSRQRRPGRGKVRTRSGQDQNVDKPLRRRTATRRALTHIARTYNNRSVGAVQPLLPVPWRAGRAGCGAASHVMRRCVPAQRRAVAAWRLSRRSGVSWRHGGTTSSGVAGHRVAWRVGRDGAWPAQRSDESIVVCWMGVGHQYWGSRLMQQEHNNLALAALRSGEARERKEHGYPSPPASAITIVRSKLDAQRRSRHTNDSTAAPRIAAPFP